MITGHIGKKYLKLDLVNTSPIFQDAYSILATIKHPPTILMVMGSSFILE